MLINCYCNIFSFYYVFMLNYFNFKVMILNRFRYDKIVVIYGFFKKLFRRIFIVCV